MNREIAFDEQLLLALALSLAIVYPLYFMLRKRYKEQGRSIQYLIPKLCTFIGMPILSIPFLLTDILSSIEKILVIFLMIIAGWTNFYSTTAARKNFRKVIGLPPENADTEEAIKEDKNHNEH